MCRSIHCHDCSGSASSPTFYPLPRMLHHPPTIHCHDCSGSASSPTFDLGVEVTPPVVVPRLLLPIAEHKVQDCTLLWHLHVAKQERSGSDSLEREAGTGFAWPRRSLCHTLCFCKRDVMMSSVWNLRSMESPEQRAVSSANKSSRQFFDSSQTTHNAQQNNPCMYFSQVKQAGLCVCVMRAHC